MRNWRSSRRTIILVVLRKLLLKRTIDHIGETVLLGFRVRRIGLSGGSVDLLPSDNWVGPDNGVGGKSKREATDQKKREKPHRFYGEEFVSFTPPHLSGGVPRRSDREIVSEIWFCSCVIPSLLRLSPSSGWRTKKQKDWGKINFFFFLNNY